MRFAIPGGIALATALGTGALAEGWTVTDFNSVNTRDICMAYAELTFQTYNQQVGSNGFIGRSNWTVGGYDLRGEVVDGLFICADEAVLVAPFLVLHNTDDDGDARELIADRLGDIWDDIVASGGAPSGTLGAAGGATK
jgi:hypothetical protein